MTPAWQTDQTVRCWGQGGQEDELSRMNKVSDME